MNILFVSYGFPPVSSPGSLRIYNFAKYLSLQEGYSVDVLYCLNGYSSMKSEEKKWDFSKINLYPVSDILNKNNFKSFSNTANNGSSSISSNLKKTVKSFVFPDRDISWFAGLLRKDFPNNNYDYILCSYPNITNLIAGYYYSKKFETPLIVDMRDLWTQDVSFAKKSYLKRKAEKLLERKILNHAEKILSISEYNCDELCKLYGDKVSVIYNGFEDDKFLNNVNSINTSIEKESTDERRFSLVYTGSFYNGERKVDKLFSVLQKLKTNKMINKDNFVFEVYGNRENYIKILSDKFDLNDIVLQEGLLSQEDLFKKIYHSDLLLVVTRDLDISKGEMTTKVFEYIALGNQILCLTRLNFEIVDMLKEVEYSYCIDLDDEVEMESVIKKLFLESMVSKEQLRRGVDFKYSRNTMSEKLKSILENKHIVSSK